MQNTHFLSPARVTDPVNPTERLPKPGDTISDAFGKTPLEGLHSQLDPAPARELVDLGTPNEFEAVALVSVAIDNPSEKQ